MEQKLTNQVLLNAPLKIFLEMCIWEKGIKDIDEEVKQVMVGELAEDFMDFLWQALFSKLKDSDLPHWKELIEKNPNPQAVQTFFVAKLPDYENVVENTMIEFKDVYVSA